MRKGWTTGACATAATKAALTALLTGEFPDPVSIRLPGGQEPAFALAYEQIAGGQASAGIIKDAGDDPDVTHGATVIAIVRRIAAGSGIRFVAGDGVGTVTRPGLPLAIGEPAINPVPRAMMVAEVEALAKQHGVAPDVEIIISIPGGQALAEKTWNPRLGIIGGLSVLGTTGIVNPFSCAAWIHSIHRGIDVARAMGLPHVLGATGSTSERAAQQLYGLPEEALLDMGDFAGGLLKYLRQHPVPRLTIAGGFAKMSKLAQGALDLHSARSQIDNSFMETLMSNHPLSQDIKERIRSANTALEILEVTRQNNLDMATPIAQRARQTALSVLRGADIAVDVIVTDRTGAILAIAS
ncbi:cobalt-precorrin-5B (C(1))-methyltransferase [Agrobacterium vitis]|uniref:Cobalt-precorrin-5B C(1)-methyltransferase n=1 Tax=Agrobacterium vitis TaxID=373 RepID=A0AAE2RFR3_AGRVI|nr:cobalt-precorrin-5B (C(1))-methyltransferase [Agrobacterium vitis]MUZ65831.1 cobalt-precorrin-5B (C(1))-methyltransferase [Agrobacterium vitis]MVA17337.1 cobalt-precorrin-5B (C(1))-methyltransferase [Agrobacterium vitis]